MESGARVLLARQQFQRRGGHDAEVFDQRSDDDAREQALGGSATAVPNLEGAEERIERTRQEARRKRKTRKRKKKKNEEKIMDSTSTWRRRRTGKTRSCRSFSASTEPLVARAACLSDG